MTRAGRGFTLIELMIIIAIIGVLASLAISAYQTYTVRTQVAEGLALAAGVEAAVADAYERAGSPPGNRLEAGLSADASDTQGSYVTRVEVVDGRVDITFGNDAHSGIATATLSLTPYVSEGVVIWRCGHAPIPGGEPMSDATHSAGYQPGSIDRRYLPSSCR